MSDVYGATTLRIRGWLRTADAPGVVRDLWGTDVITLEWEPRPGRWSVANRIDEDVPVGAVTGVVRFTATDATAAPAPEVLIVPGSQGCPGPERDDSPGVARVAVRSGEALLLDSRCWCRVDDDALDVALVAASPAPGAGGGVR